jgi:integrase
MGCTIGTPGGRSERIPLRAGGNPGAAMRRAIDLPKVEYAKALSRDQISDLLKAFDSCGGHRATVTALRLILLTVVLTAELRGAAWAEADLLQAEWRIAGGRMKMRDAYLVPLPDQALALLEELHTHMRGRQCLLRNYRIPKTQISETILNRALERMGFSRKDGIGSSAHGFRATASTIPNEQGSRADVIECQLALAERNKTRASYNQAEYLDDRQLMLQHCTDFVDEI